MSKKIKLIPDESMENREKGIRGSKVQVALKTGQYFESTVLTPKGEGESSLSWEDLKDKLFDCARYLEGSYRTDLLFDLCMNICEDDKFLYPAVVLLDS